ncbi:type II toxin-antitoxin system RelE/ParE family toxin [Pseudomonas monteilii]|uniref:type II toxin-antitoxin system RelE/ParE family toxin n=1 Tax=Pseudomonas monteilii TaxID=76759 RepID=UPI00380BA848
MSAALGAGLRLGGVLVQANSIPIWTPCWRACRQYGQDPERPIKSLTDSVGAGAIELIINGSPAFRCVYVAKYADMVVVLHSFVKTTNRSDRHAMQVAEDRLKELKLELRKMGYRV